MLKISKKNITLIKKELKSTSDEILRSNQIKEMLNKCRKDWDGINPIKSTEFFSFIEDNKLVKKVEMNFPNRKETRYLTKKISDYKILLSLSPDTYFSHLTAAYFNDLIQKEPNTLYVNTEQSRKKTYASVLEQGSIDIAFRNPARISKNFIELNGKTIYHINSKYSECLGVVSNPDKIKNVELKYTDLERTLVDMTVRPQYSGGVKNVLEVFKRAAEKIDVEKILTYLKKLNYAYPYQQCIGFYLQRVDFDETKLKNFKGIGMEFNFYCCNEIQQPAYSEEWKLYYPKSLGKV